MPLHDTLNKNMRNPKIIAVILIALGGLIVCLWIWLGSSNQYTFKCESTVTDLGRVTAINTKGFRPGKAVSSQGLNVTVDLPTSNYLDYSVSYDSKPCAPLP